MVKSLRIQVLARFAGSFLLVATRTALQGNESGRRTAAAASSCRTDGRGCGMQLHRGRPLTSNSVAHSVVNSSRPSWTVASMSRQRLANSLVIR